MTSRVPSPLLLKAERPARGAGVIVAVASVAAATAVIYPLKTVAPVVSLGVVYLLAVVIVSTLWGLAFGIGTAVLSAAAFNFFHLPPVGRLTLADSRNWVALTAFVVVAIAIGLVAELARARAQEADKRRGEADLSAELARLLLGAARLEDALPVAAQRLAGALGVASASVELRALAPDERTLAFPLRRSGVRVGTLLLPASLPAGERARVLERVVPALEALLSAALEREELVGGVVETAALRRADTVKTALLRAVSHDLRSPLTAISAASEAVGSPSLSELERVEMATVIEEEARRLSRLVDNLLDLSRLEAGAAEPRRDWTSVEELIRAALQELAAGPEDFILSIDGELPLLRVDPVQMERAFVNVLENARRHSGGQPVSVRARAVRSLAGTRRRPSAAGGDGGHPEGHRPVGDRMIVRVVDRGPGIAPAQLERVFEPFYRTGSAAGGHRGSGLGLSIARGFTQANAGWLYAESLPGQGATFVFELPLAETGGEPADADASTPGSDRSAEPAGEPRGPRPAVQTEGRQSAVATRGREPTL
jgi:two-component system, OmpR family, sensor histidine kinase KdpD